MKPVARLNEPFFFSGNAVGCLLIHGFTGSPSEMRFLGERLASYGWTISGIRLAGHGTTPEEMAATRWEDWVADAEAGVAQLRATCKIVVAVGLSMGGLLSLDLAEKGMVDALVVLNAPMILADWRTRLVGLAKPFVRFVEKPPGQQQAAQVSSTEPERFAYSRVPTASLASLNRAIAKVRRNLSMAACPALLMQSVKDKTVTPESVKIIKAGLSSAKSLQVVYWANSGHILTLGPEREAVAMEVAHFISSLC